LGEGVGFRGWARSDGFQRRRAPRGLWPEVDDDLTGGPHLSVSRERGTGTLSGPCVTGPRVEIGAGPKWLPRAFFLFSISFSPFLFSNFRFVSNLLQIASIQTKFLSSSNKPSNVLNQ
jgi:hypothetical protein